MSIKQPDPAHRPTGAALGKKEDPKEGAAAMAQIKTTIPPMLGRTGEEKQEAVRLYDSARAYLAENRGEDAMPLLRAGALLGHTPALLHLAKL